MTDNDTNNDIERWEPGDTQAAADTGTSASTGGPRLTRNRKIALIGGAAAVIGLGAITAPVLAQTVAGHDRDHDGEQQEFEKDLAAKLGVPQAKVDDALKSMQGDRLGQRLDQLQQSGVITADQVAAIKAKVTSGDLRGAMTALRSAMMTTQLDALVKKGTITQDQADQVTALVNAGVPVGLRVPPPGATGGQQPQHVESAAHQTEQVKRLQAAGVITADQAAKINELITAKKTAEAEAAIHAAMDSGLLAQLVKAGKVTQAQADQITALQQAGVPIGIGGPGMDGPGRGDHHGMDGDHHGPDMDGDHGMGGFDGPPPMDGGQQGQGGGSQSGQFQPQSYGDGNA